MSQDVFHNLPAKLLGEIADMAECCCYLYEEGTDKCWKCRAAALRAPSQAAPVELERAALQEIVALEPRPFDFPSDWEQQIATCSECARYRDHPIQRGICDAHRKPLYARDEWDEAERRRLGYRAKDIARAALRATPGARKECGECGRADCAGCSPRAVSHDRGNHV